MNTQENRRIHPDEHWEAAAAEVLETPLPEGEREAVDPAALEAIGQAPAGQAREPGFAQEQEPAAASIPS